MNNDIVLFVVHILILIYILFLYHLHSTAAIDVIMAKKELRAEELSSLTIDDVDDKTDPERKQEERIVSWCHRCQYNIWVVTISFSSSPSKLGFISVIKNRDLKNKYKYPQSDEGACRQLDQTNTQPHMYIGYGYEYNM